MAGDPRFQLIGYLAPTVEPLDELVLGRSDKRLAECQSVSDEAEFKRSMQAYPRDQVARFFYSFRSYVVVVGLKDVQERVEAVSVEYRATMAGFRERFKPFKAESLRAPSAALINDARKRYVWVLETLSEVPQASLTAIAVSKAALRRLPAARKGAYADRRGIKSGDSDLLADVADAYTKAWENGEPPRKAVAEAYGWTLPKASHEIDRARAEGRLAPPPGKGKAGLKGRPRRHPKEGR